MQWKMLSCANKVYGRILNVCVVAMWCEILACATRVLVKPCVYVMCYMLWSFM